ALHGADGENGEIQRILEEDNIKFTGSNAKASRIAMNKFESAEIAKKLRIPVPHKIILKNNETLSNDIIDGIDFPVILKPNSEGSSLGIFKIIDKENLQEKYELLNKQYSSILIEQFIPGRELTVSILGKEALPVVEIKPKEGWYDYNNKYIPGNTEYIAPADLNESEINTIQQFALRLFDEIGCKSYARVDFRYDGNKFYLLELNTLPGMTKLSLTPMAAKAANIGFEELFQRIIENS
ncbi:MAG: D-alanine--D-alanine ligase, partial [Candidatus Cloacimonadota bacterium]|nr:D-alanine--D-alanine ligase [Candidatus Cloacimonadota bacterium]